MKTGDLIQLKTFLEVTQVGSFIRAAERLGITASAVSQSIKQLETNVGTKLFMRSTRRVVITEAGETFLTVVSPALKQLDEAYKTLRSLGSTPRGSLKITVSHVAAEQIITPVLPEFLSLNPELEVILTIDDRLVDLVANRLDAGIRRGDLLDDDMIVRRIGKPDRLILVASTGYLSQHSGLTHPSDLRHHKCILLRSLSRVTVAPWKFAKQGAAVTVVPRGFLTVNDTRLARDMAIAGLGIARLAETYVRTSVKSGALQILLSTWSPPLSAFFLYYPNESRDSVALKAFRDFLTSRI